LQRASTAIFTTHNKMWILKHERHLAAIHRFLRQLLINAHREDQQKCRTYVAKETGRLKYNIFRYIHCVNKKKNPHSAATEQQS